MLMIPLGNYLPVVIAGVAFSGVLIAHRSGVHAETTQEPCDIRC